MNVEHETHVSHFPLLILYTQTGKEVVVNEPKDISPGTGFKVLETKYE